MASSVLRDRPAAGAIPGRQVRRLMLTLARHERALADAFALDLSRKFVALGKKVAAAYRDVKATDDAAVSATIDQAQVGDWERDVLQTSFLRHYGRVVTDTVEAVNITLGVDTGIPDYVARQLIRDGGRRAGLVDVKRQTRQALFRALADGRAAGEGPKALQVRIAGYVAGGRFQSPRTRAMLIARTETKYAQNRSTMAAYREIPVVTGVIAYDNRTGHGDDECSARDGQLFSFDEADVETENEHPNGTLSWGPATGGE